MESEATYMETIRAIVVELNEKYFIKIETEPEDIRIPMSEGKPKEVKSAFNKIIVRLKEGRFRIELEEVKEDLFSQVANEYITQLNREIQEVFGEMEEYHLVTTD